MLFKKERKPKNERYNARLKYQLQIDTKQIVKKMKGKINN